jgi:hypothetical protein
MNPSNPAKVGVAFLAGIVVALASAMIYVKSSGPGAHEAVPTTIIQPPPQPESLNGGKGDEPAAQAAKVTPTVVAGTPVPAEAAPARPPDRPMDLRPSVRHSSSTRVVRASYPRRTPLPESQSTIRVEVSQLNPSTIPPGAPLPVAAPQGVRAMNGGQPQPQPPGGGAVYSTPAPPPQPHTVTLQAGTNLAVRLGETISTNHNYSGDTFRATLDSPIIMDGFVIAEKGSKVLGKIVAADKAGKFEGTANLQLTLTEISTTDGQRVRVETGFFNKKGPSNTGQEAAKIGGGAVLGAIIGAIAGGGKGAAIGAGAGGAAGTGAVLLGKGKPAVIQNETRLTFQLSSPATITEHLN